MAALAQSSLSGSAETLKLALRISEGFMKTFGSHNKGAFLFALRSSTREETGRLPTDFARNLVGLGLRRELQSKEDSPIGRYAGNFPANRAQSLQCRF